MVSRVQLIAVCLALFSLSPGRIPVTGGQNAFILKASEASNPSGAFSLSVSKQVVKQYGEIEVELLVPDGRTAEFVLLDGAGTVVAGPDGGLEDLSGPGWWKLRWLGVGNDTFIVEPGRYFFCVRDSIDQVSVPIHVLPQWSVPGNTGDKFFFPQFEVIDKLQIAIRTQDIELFASLLSPGFKHSVHGDESKYPLWWGKEEELEFVQDLFSEPLVVETAWTFTLGEAEASTRKEDDGTLQRIVSIAVNENVFHAVLSTGFTQTHWCGSGILSFYEGEDGWALGRIEEHCAKGD